MNEARTMISTYHDSNTIIIVAENLPPCIQVKLQLWKRERDRQRTTLKDGASSQALAHCSVSFSYNVNTLGYYCMMLSIDHS